MLPIIRQAELTGKRPRSLLALPRRFCERLDGPAPRGGGAEPDGRMGMLLLQLEQALGRHRWATPPGAVDELKTLVATIGFRAVESREQRHAFLTYRGDCLLLSLLHLVGKEPVAQRYHALVNEIIQILVRARGQPTRAARPAAPRAPPRSLCPFLGHPARRRASLSRLCRVSVAPLSRPCHVSAPPSRRRRPSSPSPTRSSPRRLRRTARCSRCSSG